MLVTASALSALVQGALRFAVAACLAAFALGLRAAHATPPADTAPGITCARAGLGVEAAICADPGLLALDRRIAVAYARLRAAFGGDDARTFATGQRMWLIERNECSNAAAGSRFRDTRDCLSSRMDERARLLEALQPTHAALAATVDSYRYLEPAYLQRFAERYRDKPVHLFGSLYLAACGKGPSDSLSAQIAYKGHAVSARFAHLDAGEIEFYCSTRPAAWWTGTWTYADGEAYLRVDNPRRLP